MSDAERAPLRPGEGELPTWTLALMMIAAMMFVPYLTLGGRLADLEHFQPKVGPIPPEVFLAMTNGLAAAAVLLAATGYGWAACRKLLPADAPLLLRLATSAALGLCGLSLAMMLVGSLVPNALSGTLWWIVIGAGAALAMAFAHGPVGSLSLPKKVRGGSLVWVLVAAAAGQWLAGTVLPAGWVGWLTSDARDVMGRFMQLPAEFYRLGCVTTLEHNVYSHQPLGVEMLSLLAMCLRGGPEKGVVAAKFLHGLFALIAVLATFGALQRDDDYRARAATAMLATAPWVTYLAWPGLTQLMPLCFLTLGMLWMRHWLKTPSRAVAVVIGLSAGAACWGGYAAAGVVAIPLIVVMIAAAVPTRRSADAGLVLAAAIAITAPWAVRSAIATGNPCFPLAADTLGKGHWSDESVRRWQSANSAVPGPPVPAPANGDVIERGGRPQRVTAMLLGPSWAWRIYGRSSRLTGYFHTDFGPVLPVLVAATLLAMIIRPRTTPSWDWLLVALLAAQLACWVFLSGELLGRNGAPMVVPIVLLSAAGLSRLASVKRIRWLPQKPGAGDHWGLAPATVLLASAALLGLVGSWGYFRLPNQYHRFRVTDFPESTALLATPWAMAFTPGCRYATAFDTQPLQVELQQADITSEELAKALRDQGLTHVYVDWQGIRGVSRLHGWPAEMSAERLEALTADWPVEQVFHRPVLLEGRRPTSQPASQPTSRPASESQPASAPAGEIWRTLLRIPTGPTAATRPLDKPAAAK